MRLWQQRFPALSGLDISVNLSGRQFACKDLIQTVKHVLTVSGLQAESLKLEITESVLMEDAESIETLGELRKVGVGLQIDDFGTGYSSLAYLHRLPFDTLKIDRSFISALGVRDESMEIVRAIMAMAQKLRMRVIAEGVETPAQVSCLEQVGCEFAQGYLFSRPLDVPAVEQFLTTLSSHRNRSAELVSSL
jgi:EAL domain-containing protein (putative c-di-GMP-specific phosphodiesterase class I)